MKYLLDLYLPFKYVNIIIQISNKQIDVIQLWASHSLDKKWKQFVAVAN